MLYAEVNDNKIKSSLFKDIINSHNRVSECSTF